MIEWRRVEPQPCNDGERVTLARINRDPFARAPLAIAAKLCRTHRRGDQTSRAQHVGDCAGTIVTVIIKRFVAATVPVSFMAKLVRGPDRPFYWERRILRRGRFPESKTRNFA